MQMVTPMPQQQLEGGAMGSSLAELSIFMKEQQQMLMEREGKIETRMEAQRQETKAMLEQQQGNIEAMLEQQRQEMEQQRQATEQQRQENTQLREQALLREHEALEAKLVAAVESKVGALQLRVQVLHTAQLLSDEELYSLEDVIADGCEAAPGGEGGDDRVTKMIALSERMAADGAFSRQLRRTFV